MLFPRGTGIQFVAEFSQGEEAEAGKIERLTLEFADTDVGAKDSVEPWRRPPLLPPDLFAAAAVLLDLSGAAHHVVADACALSEWPRRLFVSEKMRRRAAKAAEEWRAWDALLSGGKHVKLVRRCWRKLLEAWDDRVFLTLPRDAEPPRWWKHALSALMVADQAAQSFGYARDRSERPILDWLFDRLLETETGEIALGVHDNSLYTISLACPDIACVLPKSRTAEVGCTLRSLSHNLALLPARGLARAKWHALGAEAFHLVPDMEPLNLLLVPYPYSIPGRSFIGRDCDPDFDNEAWFKVEPKWIGAHPHDRIPHGADTREDFFVQFIERLALNAQESVQTLGGIVLPEASIPFTYFEALRDRVQCADAPDDAFANIEFIVAGTTTDEEGIQGNFAATCLFSRSDPEFEFGRIFGYDIQPKHHRWRIERSQTLAYGLGGVLPGGLHWWEQIELRSRSLNVWNFRQSSIFTALICEDLARVEPVHELVRSLGPNLVIALLLDGPQVAQRWPGRYAVGLSDDPGSSVLTLTSFGLIARHNERCVDSLRSNSVGLWRDETGDTKAIRLEEGAAATLLSLSPRKKMERTLDGREDGCTALLWTFADQLPIYASSR